jgi:inner membrane protein
VDTVTHALLGAAVVRATAPRGPEPPRIDPGTRTLIGALAAAFPDVDYLSFWNSPLTFLAEWHRGPTHSLVLVPVWALLLGFAFALAYRRREPRPPFAMLASLCALAVVSHIASDVLTAYGTGVLYPFCDFRFGLGATFVIDPYFTAIVIAALVASLWWTPRLSARVGLLALSGYLTSQILLQQQATALGREYAQAQGLENASVHAFAQPLSPFNWLIIVAAASHYHVALVNLAATQVPVSPSAPGSFPQRLQSAYRPARFLAWQVHHRYGEDVQRRQLVKDAWQHPAFREFRFFARFPALYRLDEGSRGTCVWYTDLRYVLPELMPAFRYGMCRSDGGGWEPYRLRRFTTDEREYLGS